MYNGPINSGDYFIWKPLVVLDNIEITSLQIMKVYSIQNNKVLIENNSDDYYDSIIEISEDAFRENVFDSKINLNNGKLIIQGDNNCLRLN